MTAPASPPVAGGDWLEVYSAVRPVLDRHPMIDSSTAHKLDIQAGWIVDALRALASPVRDDGSSADADTHRAAEGAVVAVETWETMAAWTSETFGPVSLERIATRANEEMQELLADPSDVTEAADVCIVLSRYPGIADAINRKMAVNRARKWRLNGDGSGYHIKTPPPAASVSPGMETLQASECTKPGEGDQ